jgi:GNAT superfamily N-acetyltransferase
MALTVREATAADAAGRARLWSESGKYFAGLDPATAREADPEGLLEWIENVRVRCAEDPAMLLLVAEIDGDIVGTVAARLLEPMASARWQLQRDLGQRRAHVDALVVAGAARRAGVGTALMGAVERWALEQGAVVVTLETGLDNPTSVPFYEERMGFTRHEVVFRKTLG